MEAKTFELPELNQQELKAKAYEYAMKGAAETLKEYYTGYNSPFRKTIEKKLHEKEIGFGIDLPDIVAILNDNISKQVDEIANAAIAQTFVPLVKRFLTREYAEMNFSEFLREIISHSDVKSSECEIEMNKDDRHGWYNIELNIKDTEYRLTLHENTETKNQPVKKYYFISLPRVDAPHNKTMCLKVDGATLEMPFTPNVLQDPVSSFVARLIIAKTNFTIDVKDFQEDMFPVHCHC